MFRTKFHIGYAYFSSEEQHGGKIGFCCRWLDGIMKRGFTVCVAKG
jgi:hypothetical protein